MEDLDFKLGDKSINKLKNIGDLCLNLGPEKYSNSYYRSTTDVKAVTAIENFNKQIEINVTEKCCKKYKKLIILTIVVILIVGITIFVILINISEREDKDDQLNKRCNIGYKLINNECKIDYFLTVVYHTKQKQKKIDLI